MRAAIYYPQMTPPLSWLKQSLLFWDHVCAIEHADYWESPDPTLQWLGEQGVFEPLVIDSLEREAQDRFQAEVESVAELASRQRLYVPPAEIEQDFIYLGKLPLEIEETLRSRSLAQETGKGELLTHRDLTLCILGLAAKHLSNQFTFGDRHYSTHTNSSLSADFAFSPLPDMNSETVLQIVLRDLLPVPNDQVSFQDILEFKASHARELLAFRRALDGLQVALPQELLQNPGAAAGVRDEFELALHDLHAAFRRRRIAFLTVGVSIFAGWALGQMAPDLTATVAWELSGFGTGNIIAGLAQVRDTPRVRDFSYLYKARQDFPGRGERY